MAESESDLVFHIVYGLFVFCVVYPPVEFQTLGLTINQLCSALLGEQDLQFIQYHIKRTTLTLVIHSFLPFIYILLASLQDGSGFGLHFDPGEASIDQWLRFILRIIAFLLPLTGTSIAMLWHLNNWNHHPICRKLKKFSNNPADWESIAESINTEYRRHDKIISKPNYVHKVIATENWLIKTSMYDVYLAHQSDTPLVADKSEVHEIAQDTNDVVQYVQMQVKSMRTGIEPFTIRINANDFKDLKDRLVSPITVLSHVRFQSSVMERFVVVLKQQFSLNPRYEIDQINETCFGCMQAEPNLKLQKNCLDVNEHGEPIPVSERCGSCFCRPMWCVSCMAQWFASRQNQQEREFWLQQKCTCPMCRTKFCILDVCYVTRRDART